MIVKVGNRQKSAGQGVWLGHLSHQLIHNKELMQALEDWPITGMEFSPRAIYQELANTDVCNAMIAKKLSEGLYGEPLVYNMLIEHVRYAADLLRPVYDRTNGADGWAVMPVSPLSTADNRHLTSNYKQISLLVERPNTLLCLPVTPDRLPLISDLVYAGVPLNISNVYSGRQYTSVGKAYIAGVERRLEAGGEPGVPTFITVNMVRLASARPQRTEPEKSAAPPFDAVGEIYQAMRQLNDSRQWHSLRSAGARPLRVVWSYCGGDETNEIDYGSYSRLASSDTILAIPLALVAGGVIKPVDQSPRKAVDGNPDLLMDSTETGLEFDSKTDMLQREYIGWISREWATLLESYAKRSAQLTRKETAG